MATDVEQISDEESEAARERIARGPISAISSSPVI